MSKGLTLQRIVNTALLLADTNGLDRLSMRKIANELDVEAMSLYRHVANKEALLSAMHDHLLASVELTSEGEWPDRVRGVARSFRACMEAHPRCVPLLARSASTPEGMRLLEGGVRTLMEAGFDESRAIVAFQTVFCWAIGHGQFHVQGGQDATWARMEFDASLELLIAGIASQAPD